VARNITKPADIAVRGIGDLPVWVAEVPHERIEGGVGAALDPVAGNLAQLANISKRRDGLVRPSRRGGGGGGGPVVLLVLGQGLRHWRLG